MSLEKVQDLQDKLQHDRAVQLESAEFHKRYALRVVDDQDDIALYEQSPIVRHDVPIRGFVYDVLTGRLREVAAGRRG